MKSINTIVTLLAVVAIYAVVGASDFNEQQRAEQYKAETIAAAREAAHRKAQEMRRATQITRAGF